MQPSKETWWDSRYDRECINNIVSSPWVQGPAAHGYAIYSSPVDVIVINRLLSQVEWVE